RRRRSPAPMRAWVRASSTTWRCAGGDRKTTRAEPRGRRRPRHSGRGLRAEDAIAQLSISMRPRWYAFARRRGTEAVRPRTVTCTRSALLAFHCERRERVRARDILNLGTAMGRSLTVRRVNERWHPPEQRPEPGPT